MKHKHLQKILLLSLIAFASMACNQQKKLIQNYSEIAINSNVYGLGEKLELNFQAGTSHNHPTFALWIEDMEGNFIQTLFVTRSLGTGIYGHKPISDTEWSQDSGRAVRPATLPYWLHKRSGIQGKISLPSPENPVPDAYTAATPKSGFKLYAKTDEKTSKKFRLMLEVNQTWDWNDFWNNNKYPNDKEYKTSCQPSLIYMVDIDPKNIMDEYVFNPIGHGHYSGKNGNLYTDISTITTAKDIFSKISVKINED